MGGVGVSRIDALQRTGNGWLRTITRGVVPKSLYGASDVVATDTTAALRGRTSPGRGAIPPGRAVVRLHRGKRTVVEGVVVAF